MLDVIFYQSTEDLNLIKTDLENPFVICPSPLVADGLRRLLPPNAEVITISKWVNDFLLGKNQKRSNKAELMLRLSSVWRHYFPTEGAHLFFKAFELFTDLRSFSLNLEMLSEFLKEVDPVMTKSIYLFWTFLENEKMIDEHQSYQLLSDYVSSRALWFIGFKHLSGIQIDMLKEIGEKTAVTIFYPKEVYLETVSTDWIRWIAPDEKIENESSIRKLQVTYFPKNKLNLVLNSIQEKGKGFDVALATPYLDFSSKQETFLEDQFFKSPEDIFYIQREKLIDDLGDELGDNSILINDFSLRVDELKKEYLKSENYIGFKVLQLLQEALTLYGEFQERVDDFSLKVFKMILELNSPRVALATLMDTPKTRLLELNELPYYESKNRLVVIASSQYAPLKSGNVNYSEKMIESLRAIAPIKRAGLDFSYLKNELIQTLSRPEGVLLMEEGLEIVDLSWREILKGFELECIYPEACYQLKERKDYLLNQMRKGPFELSNFSASRIQAYIDCPRKYYFSYIEKMDHRPEERLKIGADEMGTIEHSIIENYFKSKEINDDLIFDKNFHEKLCLEALEVFLKTHRVFLGEKEKLTTYYELLHYTQNGIEFLIDFCQKNKAIKLEFESSLGNNSWNLIGVIDCLVHLQENHVALFDFKRSGAAIGTKKETLGFEKVQVWIYLLVMLRERGVDIHSWGYINLSEIESSQIYNEAETFFLSEEVLDKFQNLLILTIDNLKNEIHFKAHPRIDKICDFCEVQLFCDKGSCSP